MMMIIYNLKFLIKSSSILILFTITSLMIFTCWHLFEFAPPSLHPQLRFHNVATASTLPQSMTSLQGYNTSTISICHPDWTGIRAATATQGFPVLQIPGILSRYHHRLLVHFILDELQVSRLIINGIPPGFIDLVYDLKYRKPDMEILLIYHGSFAQEFHYLESGDLNRVIVAARDGIISRVGILKNGMVQTMQAFGIPAFELWNIPPMISHIDVPETRPVLSRWKIGIFGSGELHKNVLTQIVAVCQFPHATIYLRKKPDIPYLQHCKATIIETGKLSYIAFLKHLQTMDLTLYVSLTEAFPMTVIESLSLGVPCLTSATSAIFEVDEDLRRDLTVLELDAPDVIAKRVQYVMGNHDEIRARGLKLIPIIRQKAENMWQDFILQTDKSF